MGPLILLLLGGLFKGHVDCGNQMVDMLPGGAWLAASMPPALLAGGRDVFMTFQSNFSAAGGSSKPEAAPNGRASTAAYSDLGHDLPWLQARAAGLARSWGFGSRLTFAQVAGDVRTALYGTMAHASL